MRPLTLSDGTALPKGSRIMVVGKFQDPDTYENPGKFDAARFLKLRAAESNNSAYQYVSTSADMFAFGMAGYLHEEASHANNDLTGYGKHACPGRFFTSSELKIALAHMILKYDWKLDDSDNMPKFFLPELATVTNPGMKLC